MAASTITLNAATTVGDKPLVDTLTTVDGAAAPVGASVQMVKAGFGAPGDFKTVTPAQPMPIVALNNGLISTVNSTAVALAAGQVFTGPWEDITDFADIRITGFADQPSAIDGLQLQQSSNAANADISDNYTLPANTGRPFSVAAAAKFFRFVYTNGATAQTAFRLQTKYYKGYTKGASVRPQDARSRENDMEEILSYAMHYDGVGAWNMQRGSIANGLVVDVSRVLGTSSVAGTRSNAGTAPVAGSLHLTVGGSDGTNLRPMSTDVTGRLNVNANATMVAGTAVFGALVANQTVNLNQIAGVAPAVGTGTSTTGTQRTTLATDIPLPPLSEQRASTLHVSATGAVNTAVTASLPAPAAGLFHYITSIQVVKVYSALGVAAGAGVGISSINLPGAPAWTTEQAAGAVGTAVTVINYQPTTPLRAAAAATLTTIAAPAQLQTIWRMNVSYFTAT